MAEKLQSQLFQARDSADKERTELVERAAKAEAALTDARAELGARMLPSSIGPCILRYPPTCLLGSFVDLSERLSCLMSGHALLMHKGELRQYLLPAEHLKQNLKSLQTQLTERQAELHQSKEHLDAAGKENGTLKVRESASLNLCNAK